MRVGHVLLAERPPLARVAALPNYRWLVVGTVCVGAFLGQLDASIAGLVLPTLEEVFHAPVAAIEWVAISYLLTLAALVVVFGRLADMVGRKALYNSGFVVFILGSALCGVAPSLAWLIVFRVAQATGAAMLQANSVAIITAAVERAELGRAIGIQGAAQAVGLSIGPSVGGLLITSLGWRWVFFIAVPFGLLGALLAWFVLPAEPPLNVGQRFDWLGALLFGPTVCLLLVALTYASTWGWLSPALLAALAGVAVLLAAFVLHELRAPAPLLDFGLFRHRLFTLGILSGLLSYAVMFGSLFLVPFYLERLLDQSPERAGLLLSPLPIALALLAPLAGLLTDRIGSRLPTTAGMALACVALSALALAERAPLPLTLALLALLGAGLGLFTPPNNSTIMSSAPPERWGVAGGVLNMTRSLGTSLGVAVTGTVLTVWLSAEVGYTVATTVGLPASVLVPAFRATLLFLSAVALVTAALSAQRGPAEPRKPAAHASQLATKGSAEAALAEAL